MASDNDGERSCGPELSVRGRSRVRRSVLDRPLPAGEFAGPSPRPDPTDELTTCVEAAHACCLLLHSEQPVVVIPAYRGSRRHPNLIALLATGLARDGARVLVHGVAHERARTTCAEVLHDLGLPPCRDRHEVENLWTRRAPAFVDVESLCPPLHEALGGSAPSAEREAARRVAALLAPVAGAPSLRLIGLPRRWRAEVEPWLQRIRGSAVLLDGARGDPVGDPLHSGRIDVVLGGRRWPAPGSPSPAGGRPLLPRTHDAATTALYVQGVLSGEQPMPGALAHQLAVVQQALAAMGAPTAGSR